MLVPHVSIQHLTLAYQGKTIFSNLDLELPSGQWIALLGESGVGKSSLLRGLAGLTAPEQTLAGKILVDNDRPLMQQVAYLGQTDLLLPWLSVLDNALLAYRLNPHLTYSPSVKDQALALLTEVGLGQVSHYFPYQLSGGMRQRVALVRTLMQNKPIVLMDEPFSAIDTVTRYQLQALAATLLKGKTVLFVTHDPLEALRLAHHIYLLQGQPATLKDIQQLTSPIPRALHDAKLLALQAPLFQALTEASKVA